MDGQGIAEEQKSKSKEASLTRLDPKHAPLQASDCGPCWAFQLPKEEKVLERWISGVLTQKTMEKCNAYDDTSAVGDTDVKLPSYQNIT